MQICTFSSNRHFFSNSGQLKCQSSPYLFKFFYNSSLANISNNVRVCDKNPNTVIWNIFVIVSSPYLF